MNIVKIIACLITLSLAYSLNAGKYNGYTATCTGITTAKPDSSKPQYRIKLTESGYNCTRASGGAITEISEIVTPGASFTSIGKTFVTPSEGFFSYAVTATILIGDTGENVVAGPYTVLEITPDILTKDRSGYTTWNISETSGTKVATIGAHVGIIDLTQ